MISPALLAVVAAGHHASGATCPDYSTVTLRVESPTYTPPTTDAVLTVLNCPYTPPTVV